MAEQDVDVTTFDRFVLRIYFREYIQLCEGEIGVSGDGGEKVRVMGIVLVQEGEGAVFVFPWEMVRKFNAAERTIEFLPGTELMQLHDGAVAVRFEKFTCRIAPNKVLKIEVMFRQL